MQRSRASDLANGLTEPLGYASRDTLPRRETGRLTGAEIGGVGESGLSADKPLSQFYLTLVKDEDGSGDNGRPQAAFVTHGRLGNVRGAHDLVGDAINFLLLIPRPIGIELHVQRGRQHLGGEFFGVVAGGVFGFAERMVFAQV